MKSILTKELLYNHYHEDKLSPYKIAELYSCNHKTIRAWLKKFDIPLRTASEYNYLPKIKHTSPDKKQLLSKLSLISHTMYLCEGWHTANTTNLYFCNQDINLINIYVKCLREIYSWRGKIYLEICSNKTCEQSQIKVKEYKNLLAGNLLRFSNDPTRKNPIIRVITGGRNLSKEFIENAYWILSEVGGNEGN